MTDACVQWFSTKQMAGDDELGGEECFIYFHNKTKKEGKASLVAPHILLPLQDSHRRLTGSVSTWNKHTLFLGCGSQHLTVS